MLTIAVGRMSSSRSTRRIAARPGPAPSTTTWLLDRDCLGKVSRLVDVEPSGPSHVIREQLERNHREQDLKQRIDARDVDDMLGMLGDLLASVAGDREDPRAPRSDLREIRQQLRQDVRVVG